MVTELLSMISYPWIREPTVPVRGLVVELALGKQRALQINKWSRFGENQLRCAIERELPGDTEHYNTQVMKVNDDLGRELDLKRGCLVDVSVPEYVNAYWNVPVRHWLRWDPMVIAFYRAQPVLEWAIERVTNMGYDYSATRGADPVQLRDIESEVVTFITRFRTGDVVRKWGIKAWTCGYTTPFPARQYGFKWLIDLFPETEAVLFSGPSMPAGRRDLSAVNAPRREEERAELSASDNPKEDMKEETAELAAAEDPKEDIEEETAALSDRNRSRSRNRSR